MTVPLRQHNQAVFRVAAAGLLTGFVCGGIDGALLVATVVMVA